MHKKMGLLVIAVLVLAQTYSYGQSWRFTGEISSSRRHMRANVLLNGSVLITGGNDNMNTSLTTCELFDPATEKWTETQGMKTPRFQHTTHVLSDGRVVAIAGYNDGMMVSSVEIYDPTAGTWSDGGMIITARMNHTSILLQNGKILIVGGFDGSDFLKLCELYDPATKSSVAAGSLKLGRHDHNAILLKSGKVLITGGRVGGADGVYLNEAELYDPTTDAWTVINPMNSSRIIGTLVEFSDETVLAAGGRATANNATQSADLFDPVSQTWTATSPMKEPRHWQGESLMPNDRYLITGGIKDADWASNNVVQVSNTCEWYDKALKSWYYAPDLNFDRSQHDQVFFTQDGNTNLPKECVMVIGGIRTGVSVLTSTCEVLDVSDKQVQGYMMSPRNTTQSVKNSDVDGVVRIVNNATASPVLIFTDKADVQNTKIDLVNEQGLLISSIDFAKSGFTAQRYPLDSKNLANGLYFLRIRSNGNSTKVLKLLIAK